MTPPASTLIVGGGIAGLATAWWLGRAGAGSVRLLERDSQLAGRSSALNAAILRTLDPDPEVTALSERSARFLRTPPEGFCEHPLVDACGLILTADAGPASEALAGWIAHCDPRSEVERLDAADLRALAPHYDAREQSAWRFPHEGRLDVAHLCDAFARGARRAGVELRTGADGEVRRLLSDRGRVRGVELADGRRLEAERVVLAAGGWAGNLGARAGSRLALHATRRHLLVTEPDAALDPRWPVVWRHGEDFYCRPESGGMLLCACDQSDVADPDALQRDPEVLELFAAKTADNLPTLADAGAAHWWCGLRTFTPTGRFAIGDDPEVAGLFWVAGLGGHGMSAGAEAGRLAAALLCGEDPPEARAFRPTHEARTSTQRA